MKTNPVKNRFGFEAVLPWLLAIFGIIGLLASFMILFEKINILEDPSYTPSCSLNPIISCGSVMSSPQGSVFGFPNPILGVIGFSVVVTIGMAVLAGAAFKRWFWLGLQTGTILAVAFSHWLFYQSVYNIQALCPYCIIVWICSMVLLVYVTMYNVRYGNIKLPAKLAFLGVFLQKHHGEILVVWALTITGLILHHFWYYFGTLL